MGYYTQASFIKVSGSDEDYRKYLAELAEATDEPDIESEDINVKFYNIEEDVVSLSRHYPELTVEIKGHGEDWDDIWLMRVRNGESETVGADIVFGEFTSIK